MYQALVCCQAGMGSSMLLKIRADHVIEEYNMPITTMHGTMDSLIEFDGDLVITMHGLKDQLMDKVPYVIGIRSVIDQEEMKRKLEAYLKWKENQ